MLTCDAALSGSYGLKVTASSATLKDFTLDGSGVAVFGIHVQPGTSNSTIQGVTAHGCVQNGISLTGTNDTEGRNTITGITVHSNGLLGLGLGASQNVTVSDVTSYSNAFGDIGMYIGDYEGQQNDDLIFEEPLALSGGFGGISYTIEANDPAGFEVTPSTADATDALYNADANIFVPAAYNHSVQVHVPASPYNADLTSYVLTQDAAAALIAGALNVAPNDNVAVQNLETGAWEVSAGLSIGVAAGLATEGDVIEVAAGGTYAESLTIDKGLSIDGNGSTLDVSGLGVGISIQSDVDGVTIDNLTIVGDASTYSGITVNPGASNVSILNNNISGMALSNPGNSSPLSYGILCWGNTDPVNPPTNVLIDGNEIHGGVRNGDFAGGQHRRRDHLQQPLPQHRTGDGQWRSLVLRGRGRTGQQPGHLRKQHGGSGLRLRPDRLHRRDLGSEPIHRRHLLAVAGQPAEQHPARCHGLVVR